MKYILCNTENYTKSKLTGPERLTMNKTSVCRDVVVKKWWVNVKICGGVDVMIT